MATNINLMSVEADVLNSSRWSTTNSTIRAIAKLAYQETSLGSGIGKDALLVTSVGAGEMVVRSPLFAVESGKSYKASGILTIGAAFASQTAKIKIEYFTVSVGGGGAPVDPIGEDGSSGAWVASSDDHEIQTLLSADADRAFPVGTPMQITVFEYGFRTGVPVYGSQRFWVPSGANYARAVFTVDSAAESGQGFVLSDVFAVDMTVALNSATLNNTYGLIPEFVRIEDADSLNATFGHSLMVKKLLSSAFASGIGIGEDLRSWAYTRATDSSIAAESKSALTDPQQIKRSYFDWLAQLVGVDLINPFTGLSMWLSLPGWVEDTDSTTWQNIDMVDDEDLGQDSAAWQKVRSASYEDEQSYRDQMDLAFNGLNAGKPETMQSYLGTILDTPEPENYFRRIKTLDREFPFLVKYVYDPEVDPDPEGTRVSVEMDPMLSMGVVGDQSNKPRDAGVFAFEAKDILEANVPGGGVAANDDTVLRFGNDACAAIPDMTGSGRHISLLSSTTAIDVKDSRYGIISGARYNPGFAFYPSGVTGSKVFMRADAVTNGLSGGETEADYLFLVSDINYGNSSDIVLLQQGTSGNANYRACVIDETGVLKYLTGASGSAASSAYVSGTHTTLYDFTTLGLRWIRFSVSASTTKFYVAPSLVDACHPTSYLINSVSLSTPNVYDKTLSADIFRVDHGENGVIGYRAIVNDGPLNSSYVGLWG